MQDPVVAGDVDDEVVFARSVLHGLVVGEVSARAVEGMKDEVPDSSFSSVVDSPVELQAVDRAASRLVDFHDPHEVEPPS